MSGSNFDGSYPIRPLRKEYATKSFIPKIKRFTIILQNEQIGNVHQPGLCTWEIKLHSTNYEFRKS